MDLLNWARVASLIAILACVVAAALVFRRIYLDDEED